MFKKLSMFIVVTVISVCNSPLLADEDIEIITEDGEIVVLIDCEKNNETSKSKKSSSKASKKSSQISK